MSSSDTMPVCVSRSCVFSSSQFAPESGVDQRARLSQHFSPSPVKSLSPRLNWMPYFLQLFLYPFAMAATS